jgi:hypothetical protein
MDLPGPLLCTCDTDISDFVVDAGSTLMYEA